MLRHLALAAAALSLTVATAHAQDCDPATEVAEIAPAFQARMAELTSGDNPDVAQITRLSELLNGAGQKAGSGDTAGACADYATLRQELGMGG